jgi:hypothetical protein
MAHDASRCAVYNVSLVEAGTTLPLSPKWRRSP